MTRIYNTIPPIDRFLNKIIVLDSKCWEWIGAKNYLGYGLIMINSKTVLIHRFIYKYYFGTIDVKLKIDHLCRNRSCGNPLHLELTTQKVNICRGFTGLLNNRNKEKTHCKRGHEFTNKNTGLCKNGRFCKKCVSNWNKVDYQQKKLLSRILNS